jgi:uncharacterized membrane protein YfcA
MADPELGSLTISNVGYLLLFGTGAAAGFVDSIAGGGGVITLPVLLNLGLPPAEALGTNKLQAIFGSASATWHYRQAGLIAVGSSWPGIVATLAGAVAGTLSVRSLDPALLRQMIPWLLLAIAFYVLVQPNLGKTTATPRCHRLVFHCVVGLGLGFYDGFLGPGTGTFWAMAYVLLLGYDLRKATAHTKLMNLSSNVASLAVFLVGGQLHYGAGLCLGAGQLVGARLGSGVVIREGARWIRPLFIAVAVVITLRLLWVNR